jgi:hypothetical protein
MLHWPGSFKTRLHLSDLGFLGARSYQHDRKHGLRVQLVENPKYDAGRPSWSSRFREGCEGSQVFTV